MIKHLVLLCLLATPVVAAEANMSQVLTAIHQVEASGQLNPKAGDGGKAIGPFQIHKAYWKDAVAFDPSIGGRYEDCRKYDYGKKVVSAYLRLYAGRFIKHGNNEALLRVHNGGPDGWKEKSTNAYWLKAKRHFGK